MPDRDADPLIVAISSRTLFDMEDSHALFEREGIDSYAEFQRAHEDDLLGRLVLDLGLRPAHASRRTSATRRSRGP